MGKEQLWSMSTTVREAERIVGFLATAKEMEGEKWTRDNQIKFQILLIKNRQYLNDPDNAQTFNKMNEEQCSLLREKETPMTYEQAENIFYCKEYQDPPMRGRQSMKPLEKLGLVFIVDDLNPNTKAKAKDKIIRISPVGDLLLQGKISFADFMLDCLLKYQYPNPFESSYQSWNTKPFINILRLIKKVNELCVANGEIPKGITKEEFGIFCLSLKSFADVDVTAKELLHFREQVKAHSVKDRSGFIDSYIEKYLSDFNNPVKNTREYTDNMIRYARLTKYIYIRGKYDHTYIDLEPRRMKEIDSILNLDDGRAISFTKEEWVSYMGKYRSYQLPFETEEELNVILDDIINEIHWLENELGLEERKITKPQGIDELKNEIEKARYVRTFLQNLKLKKEYHEDSAKIEEAIQALEDILKHNKAALAKKYSIELEKWANVALNILNDAVSIIPNAPVGDDNEPIYTAPAGVADINCVYDNFVAICEVTTLTNRDQWFNEGQPVMRHLRSFEDMHTDKPGYCLFIAPSLHIDTLNTFYIAVKYEYESKAQKIVPITISQLISILKIAKARIQSGKIISHEMIKQLYDSCVEVKNIHGGGEWKEYLVVAVNEWMKKIQLIR